ncbi:MAG: hypothetical protein R3199_11050 [Gemmatimonadota bacterium]|nr:hypothetical protein [Gemmatimonadota bacterium]
MRTRLLLVLLLGLAGPHPLLRAQEADPAGAPPPGGIVPEARDYALGVAGAWLRWDGDAPYEDTALVALEIDRALWSLFRGRAGVSAGSTSLTAGPVEDLDTWVMSFDLQLLLGADFGPFRQVGVVPYAIGGVGSLVTNPEGRGEMDLPTRSQSMWTYGAGVRGRVADRWEARLEGTVQGVRLADPVDPQDRESDTIHNTRWEGSVQWLF